MTQEELLVSPETFKTLEMLLQNFMEGSVRVSIPNAKSQNDYFGFKHGNHALIVKKKQNLKKGDWYIHTESGQEKMIFMVVDPEKQLCSGWDCKGKFFSKEWLFVGDRFKKITESESVIKTHTLGYKVGLLMDDVKSMSDEANKI